jgi:tetratricopeptide (TPR) repeat protein
VNRWLGFWVVLGVSLLVAACTRPPLSPPSRGGEPWSELATERFTLVTDLGERDAQRVIGGLEETYELLGSVIFPDGQVPSFHTSAVVFREYRDLQQFVGDDVGGAYWGSLANDLEPSPTVIASGTLSPYARILFAHELTHRFNHVALGPLPIWMNEGFAEYFSTIRAEDGKPVLGETDPRFMCAFGGSRQAVGDLVRHGEILRAKTLPEASELIAMDRSSFYADEADEAGLLSWEQKQKRSRHYGTSWLLVHLLMHQELSYARRFREVLAQPSSPHKGEALARVVEAVPAAELNRDLRAYLQNTVVWRQHHAAAPSRPEGLVQRALPESDVLIWWARLDDFSGDRWSRALGHLEAASRSSGPNDGDAWFWLGRYSLLRKDVQEAEERYGRALQREPHNPEFLYGLLDLHWNGRNGQAWVDAAKSEKVSEIIEKLSRLARTAQQHNAVAAHRLFSGDVEGALASSGEACRLGPACWSCFHNRAAAFYAAGSLEQAVQAAREAESRLPEWAASSFATGLASARAFYERALKDPSSVQGSAAPGLIAP